MCINKKINQYYNWLIFFSYHKLNNILKDAAKGTAISIPIRPKAFPPIIMASIVMTACKPTLSPTI